MKKKEGNYMMISGKTRNQQQEKREKENEGDMQT